MTETRQRVRRVRGSGCLIPAGDLWAVKYVKDGQRKYKGGFSTRDSAEEFLSTLVAIRSKNEIVDLIKRSTDRGARLERLYSVALIDYQKLLIGQGGRCAICRRSPQGVELLQVDHDHASGVLRGLLCLRCNRGLGFFRDSEEILAGASAYLKDPVAAKLLGPRVGKLAG